MNQEDAEDMADLAFGGSSAVSGDASECTVNMLASRVCSRGTKGCILNHSEDFLASQASPAKRGAEPSDYCRTVNEFSDEERERAVTAYTLSHYNAAPDFGFAPDRAWLEGYGHAALAQSAPSKRGTEPSLDAEVKKRIAANVYAHCAQIPGANSYTAAEFAITETLEALAESAPSEKLAGALKQIAYMPLTSAYVMVGKLQDIAREALASHAQMVPQVAAGQASIRRWHRGSHEMELNVAGDWVLWDEVRASLQPEAAGAAQPSDNWLIRSALRQAIQALPESQRRSCDVLFQTIDEVFARTPTDAGGAK